MFLTQISCTAVSQTVVCGQIYKQTLRLWRFSSTVSNIDCNNNALKLSNKGTSKEKTKTRRRLQEPHLGVPAAFSLIPKKNHSVRILDENAASDIVQSVNNVFNKNNVILEFDAGLGLLSNALLEGGMKSVVALEPQPQFHTTLETIKKTHKHSFKYFLKSINEVIACSHNDLSVELPDINICETGCNVQIIGHAPSWHLLVEVARRMRNPRSFLLGKSMTLCLCLPETAWKQFLDSKVQKMCVVERILFMLAFNYKILARFPKNKFYFCVKKKDEIKMDPNDDMVLVEVTSKPTQGFDLTEMQVFLTQFHNCTSRNRLVIPSLEQWSPSCGEELVKRGMPVFTRFSDLTPKELLDVFLYFKSLPNVEASDFLLDWRTGDEL